MKREGLGLREPQVNRGLQQIRKRVLFFIRYVTGLEIVSFGKKIPFLSFGFAEFLYCVGFLSQSWYFLRLINVFFSINKPKIFTCQKEFESMKSM